MKKYLIKLIYFDSKEISLIIDEPQLPKFLNCIRDNSVYWEPNNSAGFYTQSSNIRYLNVIETKQEEKKEVPEVQVIPETAAK